MKTKVQILNRKFYVNEEKKTVACVIEAELCINKFPIGNILMDVIGMKNTSKKLRNLWLPFTFTGKAKCSPSDTFDEVKGKRIAESRAKEAAFKFFKEQLLILHEAIDTINDEVYRCFRACAHAEQGEFEHYNKLVYGNMSK